MLDKLSASDIAHDNSIPIAVDARETPLIQHRTGGRIARVNRLARAEQRHYTTSLDFHGPEFA